MSKHQIATLFLLLCLSFTMPMTHSQTNQIQILIVYDSQQGRQLLEQMANSFNNTSIINTNIEDEVAIDESEIDIILIEGDMKDMSDSLETLIEAYVTKKGFKGIVAFSWNINELSGDTRRFLGVENILGDEGEDNLNWKINMSRKLARDEFQQFSIDGKGGLVVPTSDAIVLGNFTDVNSTEIKSKYQFPLPATVFRNNSESIALTSFFELKSEDEIGLTLSELPQDLINIFMSIFKEAFSLPSTGSISSISGEKTTTQDTDLGTVPSVFSTEPYAILILLTVLLALLFKPLIGFFRWISDKSWGLAIAIVSSVYHIQNRQLTEAQISMNPIRTAIMDYLEFIGAAGAHLREIKSIVDVGMGNLLWHLQVLEEYGWIEKRKIGRYNVYIASEFMEDFDSDLKALELELRSKHAPVLIEHLLSAKSIPLNISKIAQETGIDRKTIRNIIRTLQKFEVVKKKKTPEGVELMINRAILEETLRRIVEKTRYHSAQAEINPLNG